MVSRKTFGIRGIKFSGINLHLLEKNKAECDVCIRAKKTSSEFDLSSNKVDLPFSSRAL